MSFPYKTSEVLGQAQKWHTPWSYGGFGSYCVMKPYTCFQRAWMLCQPWLKATPSLPGGHWASDSNAVKITCPLSLRHSKEKAAQLSYRLPFFLDYMREPRRSPDPSDSGEEKRRRSRNGPALPPFPFFVISEWCLGFVRKMASVIFIQQQSTASFSLGLRVAMATPAVQSVFAEDTHSTREACVRLTNRKVSLCLLSAAETHNRLTSDMRRGADGLF